MRYEFAWVRGAGSGIISHQQRWHQLPHHAARPAGLDPPTRLTEGKPSRKNRPPFHGRKRTTATTLPPPLSSRPFLVTTTTTIGTLPSLSPAPPSLYRRLLLHRDQPSSRGTRIPELTDFDRVLRSLDQRVTYHHSPSDLPPPLIYIRPDRPLKLDVSDDLEQCACGSSSTDNRDTSARSNRSPVVYRARERSFRRVRMERGKSRGMDTRPPCTPSKHE